MAWLMLFVAGVFEVGWAVGLKYTHGFTRLWPSVLTLVSMAISVALLSTSVRTLPVGTAYAVWSGIGALGTAIMGIVLFDEAVGAARLLCFAAIIAGVLGLKLSY